MEILQECFVLRDTEFKIKKFPAMEGWQVLESIREELGRTKASLSFEGDPRTMTEEEQTGMILSLVRIVMGLPSSFVFELLKKMSKVIFFKHTGPNGVVKDYILVAGSEETAFMNLRPTDIYLLLVRSLAVNFFDSFRDVFEKISTGLQNINP